MPPCLQIRVGRFDSGPRLQKLPTLVARQADAGIAQLVERNLAKVEVASSSLVSRSIQNACCVKSVGVLLCVLHTVAQTLHTVFTVKALAAGC